MARALKYKQVFRQKYFRGRQLIFQALAIPVRKSCGSLKTAEFCDFSNRGQCRDIGLQPTTKMARAASRVQRYEEKYFRGRQLIFHALQFELRLASFRPMDAEFCDLTVFLEAFGGQIPCQEALQAGQDEII